MCTFFFQNDGIVLGNSVRSPKRKIVPEERLFLVRSYTNRSIPVTFFVLLIENDR